MSMPTSRWLTIERLLVCRNSIGSSIVTIWSEAFSLRKLIIAASVVDLPDPVEPTMSTRPRLTMRWSGSGRPRLSQPRHIRGDIPQHHGGKPRCMKTFTRKRPRPGSEIAKSSSNSRVKYSRCSGLIRA